MIAEIEVVDISLTECAEGDEAFVVSMDNDSPLSARLRALGVMTGAPIRIARTGSPMIIEIGESRLCLRANEANGVRVSPFNLAWPVSPIPVADASPV